MTDRDTLAALALEPEGHCLLAPCLEVCFYTRHANPALLQDFAAQARAALEGHLTRHMTGQMTRAGKLDSKAEAKFSALFDRPRPRAQYWFLLRGGTEGTSAAELEITFHPAEPASTTPEAIAAAIAENRAKYEERGAIFTPHVSVLRATFPLDHPLAANPAALRRWIAGLALVQEAGFLSGHAGYALNYDRAAGPRPWQQALQAGLAAALARHPGLGYDHTGAVLRKLLKYWPGHAEFLPRIKRAHWLTFVQGVTLTALCGGRDTVAAALEAVPGVRMTALAGTAVQIEAGPIPQIGDVTRGEMLPGWHAVARALAPARLPQMPGLGTIFDDDAAQAWLDALERHDD